MRQITVDELIVLTARGLTQGKLTEDEGQELMRIAAKQSYATARNRPALGPTDEEQQLLEQLCARILPDAR